MTDDKFGKLLGLAPLANTEILPPEPASNNVINSDVELARGNIHKLLQDGHATLDDLILLAQQAQNVKVYEVLVSFIRTMAQTNLDLIELQEKHKRLVAGVSDKPTTVNNNLVLTTNDLLKIIKKKKDDSDPIL